jgi:hypothetical protein
MGNVFDELDKKYQRYGKYFDRGKAEALVNELKYKDKYRYDKIMRGDMGELERLLLENS